MQPWFAAVEPIAGRDCQIAIIGAGLAGCAVAVALAKQGVASRLVDCRQAVASGASAVPRAVFKPHISRAPSVPSSYFQRAFDIQRAELERLHASQPLRHYRPLGVLQLVDDHRRWPSSVAGVDRQKASAMAGVGTPAGALHYPRAGFFNPAELCRRWLAEFANIHLQQATVASLAQRAGRWHLLDRCGDTISCADVVVIANGIAANRYSQSAAIPLQLSSGQLSRFSAVDQPRLQKAITGRGLVIPDIDHIWTGATHRRCHDPLAGITTVVPRASDRSQNLDRISSLCALAPTRLSSDDEDWAGLRASTADRLPLVGPVPDRDFYLREYRDLRHGGKRAKLPAARYHRGLFMLTGLGSRGATQATYAGEVLANAITGAGGEAEPAMLEALHPARFFIRALRRGQPIPEEFT